MFWEKGQIQLIATELKTNTELEHLVALYSVMIKNKDQTNASKIVDLYEKLAKKELMISFSGHFSAGKSSMINALMDQEILPKSPIPTSANIVKINSGEGAARVYFNREGPVKYKEPYDLDMIKEYSKDKDAIRKIEISTKEPIIPEGAAIIDTPGIDAADDADRIMTESSMHVVDVLFYVMDYNHVQSEVNLQFLKSVQEKAIPFYIIVNQIDKHDEKELLFTDFEKSITKTFKQWGIQPEKVYYTSLVDRDASQNQFKEIKERIDLLMNDKESFFNIDASVLQVIDDHKHVLKTQMEERLGDFDLNDQETQQNLKELQELETKLKQTQGEPQQLEKDFNKELQQTLNNAYLMPSSLRDKAKLFLESQQSHFKVGLFGSRKKTENEKQARLTSFFNALQENVDASIQWKLRDKLTQLASHYGTGAEDVQMKIQELQITYQKEDLLQLIKPGATVNGDSVLNYTNDVAADIKSKYKRESRTLLDFIREQFIANNTEKEQGYKQQIAELQEIRELQAKGAEMQAELNEKFRQLDEQLDHPQTADNDWKQLNKILETKQQSIKQAANLQMVEKSNNEKTVPQVEKTETNTNEEHSVEKVLTDIDKTIRTVEVLPGFETLINDLQGKQQSLENRSYTIALFGAFSAGKSSFANALMGEKVLPVSPNPTTATVNRIRPVTKEYKHGEVVVTLKDHSELANDLLQITKPFSPSTTDFNELLDWVKEEKIYEHGKLNKMYQAFLQAMLEGFKDNKDYIGKKRTISLEQFPDYVTDETKACYIESIDLYYDCSLTRLGITLVDTPGADSVNARHTNVAFDYIKHADAILYVTYYNHALSRADKDFLMQLGRVKEAFALDKMFFIVNAADLAADDKELKLVTDYVEEQLVQLGIRLPRLFPVSSKQSLESKLANKPLNDQMQKFEDRFYQFIQTDLAKLTVDSTLWDIRRTFQSLSQYIKSVNLNEDEKENRKQELVDHRDKLAEKIDNIQSVTYDKQIEQKIEKQLYYVLERLSIRFHDMFKETFNPTTITESGRKAQEQLRSSLDNLTEYVGFELLQEIQAVSLRIEAFIQKQASDLHHNLSSMSGKTDELFILPNVNVTELETPIFNQAFQQMDQTVFHKALSKFKGTKAFFEKNEKENMKEDIYQLLEPYAKQYMDDNQLKMNEEYMNQWHLMMTNIKIEAKEIIDKHIQNYEEMMTSQVDLSLLITKQKSLEHILEQHRTGDLQ